MISGTPLIHPKAGWQSTPWPPHQRSPFVTPTLEELDGLGGWLINQVPSNFGKFPLVIFIFEP